MSDRQEKNISLDKLASLVKAELVGDANHLISGVETLDQARETEASFLANPRYCEAMRRSKAGVICVDRSTDLPKGKNYLLCDNPSETFQQILMFFRQGQTNESGFTDIHETAVIHPSAKIGSNVTIGPYCVIDRDVQIGNNTTLSSHVAIGPGTIIGENALIYQHVTVREHCFIGDRVILQPGCVIGSCGFGYIPNEKGEQTKVEQLGNVILEDDVEVGANTTIDRARFKETRIGKGTKIDNLVQIGHNVLLGKHNLIVAQTGIAGSSKTGNFVCCGGQVGILGHIEIEDGTLIATRSGVSKSLKRGKYRGSPAIPIEQFNRKEVHLRKVDKYAEEIKQLKQKIKELEQEKALDLNA